MPRKILSSFSITPAMLAEVQAKCSRMGVSMAEVIRCKLHEAVQEEDEVLRKRVVEFNVRQNREE
jgi:ribbon-helix-helix CopG family protein